jgi:sarcosine oxidase subunit gamma
MSYDVEIREIDLSAIFDLKGPMEDLKPRISGLAPAFPDRANTATRSGDLELYWIGSDHWLLRGPIEGETELLATIDPRAAPGDISIVLISDTLAFFNISGPDADQIMAIASPLDTHRSAFPVNGVTFTEAFGLKALIVRRDDGYDLGCDRSYGDMVADYLQRAVGA